MSFEPSNGLGVFGFLREIVVFLRVGLVIVEFGGAIAVLDVAPVVITNGVVSVIPTDENGFFTSEFGVFEQGEEALTL